MTPSLRGHSWRAYYGPSDDRLNDFYIPALSRSRRYDRSAGYFTSSSIAIAATGLAHLIRSGGRMRLRQGRRHNGGRTGQWRVDRRRDRPERKLASLVAGEAI